MADIVLKIVLLCKLVTLVTSAPIQDESLAEIVESKNSIDEKGNYVFSFETTNGIARYEEGKVVNEGESNEHIEVTGYYSYIDDTGKRVMVSYTADENGYRTDNFDEIQIEPVSALPSAIIASLSG